MSSATLEQIQQLFEQSLGVHADALEIENHVLSLGHLHGWNVLMSFFKTDYDSMFDVEEFNQRIEHQCDKRKIKDIEGHLEIKGYFEGIWYCLVSNQGEKKGFSFHVYTKNDLSLLQSVTCLEKTIELETRTTREVICWKNRSFDLNRYTIKVVFGDLNSRSTRVFLVNPNREEGYIWFFVSPTERIQSREVAIKFASESLIYAFVTQFLKISR